MSGQSSSSQRIPALFTALGNIVGDHWRQIAGGAGGLGGLVAILDGVFGIQLVPYGNAMVEFFTSSGAVTVLLLMLLISQVLLYQRVEWIVNQLEPEEPEEDENLDKPVGETETDAETGEALTDGGSSNTPPRDSKGRFTTRDSGGSNVFLIVLAAVTGYLIGGQTDVIDPIAGALIAVALIAFLQAKDG